MRTTFLTEAPKEHKPPHKIVTDCENVTAFACAVIGSAIQDHIKETKKIKRFTELKLLNPDRAEDIDKVIEDSQREIKRLERFLKSNIWYDYCNLDSDYIFKKLKEKESEQH